jgi:hypothetical protein
MDMIILYYENPGMLKHQLSCWASYKACLLAIPRITIIDDGSTKHPAADVIRNAECNDLPLRLFRINENIPWNCAGARNLGCFQAEGWIYVSDIDILLLPEEARKLFEAMPLNKKHFYTLRRVDYRTGEERDVAQSNLLFHKDLFIKAGGYDEDYSGHYGKEDGDFLMRLQRIGRKVHRRDVTLQVVRREVIPDASTRNDARDSTRNKELFRRKGHAGFPKPANHLRFAWERVI